MQHTEVHKRGAFKEKAATEEGKLKIKSSQTRNEPPKEIEGIVQVTAGTSCDGRVAEAVEGRKELEVIVAPPRDKRSGCTYGGKYSG